MCQRPDGFTRHAWTDRDRDTEPGLLVLTMQSSGFYKIRYEIGVGWQKKLQLLGSFRDRDWRLADQSSGKRSEVHMELGNIAVL